MRTHAIIILIVFIILISGCTSNTTTVNGTISNSDDIQKLNTRITVLEKDLAASNVKINTLQTSLQQLQIQADSSTAYEIMRQTLTNPNLLADQLTTQVLNSNSNLNLVKSIVSSVIRSKLPSLSWVKSSISVGSGRTYYTSMKTIFPIEINTGLPIMGTITVAKIEIVASGLVDVVMGTVSNIQPSISIST